MSGSELKETAVNVLILTAGSRVLTVTAFKRAVAGRGRVIVTDASELAPSLYVADAHYVVPLITAPNYLATILDICREEKIDVVLSLLDPELSLLAKNVDQFEAIGTTVMISPSDVIERAFDKWEMFQWLAVDASNRLKQRRRFCHFRGVDRNTHLRKRPCGPCPCNADAGCGNR